MRRTACIYSTSKTALDRLTKGFGVELAEYGIRVNALEPGFAAGSTVSALTDAHIQNTIAQIPLGRSSSREDVGNALLATSQRCLGLCHRSDADGRRRQFDRFARRPSGQEARALRTCHDSRARRPSRL